MDFRLRKARLDDRAALDQLVAESARGLSHDDYTDEQIEAALASVFGVDTDLILDGTYFVAEHAGEAIGCGGWSRRKTLFGGDRYAERDPGMLDPATDPAKIRAFFVHPSWARKGVGRAILEMCEAEARRHGFQSFELMATLPGVKLYRACGYVEDEPIIYEIGPQVRITFVPMRKVVV